MEDVTGQSGEWMDLSEDIFTNQQFVQNNRITPAGMEELKKRMPHMDFTELEKDHAQAGRSYYLACVAGSWQFVTRPDYMPWLKVLFGVKTRPPRLSQPALETLAIIAYRQPITRAEMEQKLLEIVRKEKSLPIESLASETQLADAGIDSLDALTILFAIEEEFKISIPDDRARAMKTFGNLSNAVAEQVGITS